MFSRLSRAQGMDVIDISVELPLGRQSGRSAMSAISLEAAGQAGATTDRSWPTGDTPSPWQHCAIKLRKNPLLRMSLAGAFCWGLKQAQPASNSLARVTSMLSPSLSFKTASPLFGMSPEVDGDT